MKNIIAKGVGEIAKGFTAVARAIRRDVAYYRVKPSEALFFLTYRCSSRCQICAMWRRKKDYEEMDLAGWIKAVDMLAEHGTRLIFLFGGDLLLRTETLIPLATYIVEKGINCEITINGNLLNKDNAKELIGTGAGNIGVSIDAIGELHDRIRGVKGMFERATQGIRYMLDARGCLKEPSISVYCTVSKLNIDEYERVLPYALDLGVDQLHYEPYGEFTQEYASESRVNGIAANPYFIKWGDRSLLLNEDQAVRLKERMATLKEESRGRISLDTENIERVSVRELVTGKYRSKRCYMARYHVNVDPSGNVLPCLCFQDYHLGNLQEDHVADIWGNGKHKEFLASLKRRELKVCRQCVMGIQRNRTAVEKLKHKLGCSLQEYGRKIRSKIH